MMLYYYEIPVRRKREISATMAIIGANVLMYLVEILGGVYVILYLALVPIFLLTFAQMWRLFTHMFIHANFWHLFLNMWALYVFGHDLEREFGRKKFLILYFASGIGAAYLFSIFSVFIYNEPYAIALGASGAVFGVMAAYALFYPNRQIIVWFVIPIKMRAKTFAALYATIELLRAIFLGPYGNVAYAAHVGGFITGLLIAKYYRKKLLEEVYREQYSFFVSP